MKLFLKGRRSTSLLQSRNLTAEMACKNDKGFIKFLEESKNFTAQTEELRKLTFTQGMEALIKSEIGNFYENLGALLGVREGDLDDIETRYSRPTQKGGAVLRNWRDREGPRATVGRLETALNRLGKKRIAVMLLDIAGEEKRTEDGSEEHRKTFSSPLEDAVRKEKRTESEQNGDRSEEHRKTFSSPLEARSVKGKLDDESKRVARLENERRNNLTKLKSQRAEGKLRQCQVGERGSPETMPCSAEEPANASRTRNISLSEFKESLQTVGKMDQAWTRMEPRVDEPPRRQQNMGSNEPLKTMQNPLMEEAALKEAIEKSILVYIVGHENLEVLKEMSEIIVRKVKEEFSGAS